MYNQRASIFWRDLLMWLHVMDKQFSIFSMESIY